MKQSERDPARREKSGAAARTVKRTKVPARPAAKAAKQTKQTGRGEPPRKFRLMDAAKWTALCFLAALLIFSVASMARAHAEKNAKWENPYVDVIQSMWSYQYITELNKLGVYPDDTNFEPAASESRGGLAQALYKMDQNVFAPQREAQDKKAAKKAKKTKAEDLSPLPFSDLDAEGEITDAVRWVYDNGLMKGTSDTTFDPGSPLTREQVCAIVARFGALEEVPLMQVVEPDQFDDSLDIQDYARSGVTACQMAAVVKGNDENCFLPTDPMSRQEVAAVLYRIMTAAQAPLIEGVPLVDLSPGAYDALYEKYTRPGAYTQALVPAGEEVTMDYWDHTVFIGDSVSVMLESYCNSSQALGGAKFLCAGSMSATNMLTSTILPEWPKGSGQHPAIQDSVKATGADVVYIMLGMNNISMGDRAVEDMLTIATNIQEANPDVTLIFQSVTPMTETSPRKSKNLNNDTINAYNEKIKAMAQEHEWYFVNVAEAVRDENGFLRPEFCSDPKAMGMHFTYDGTKAWVSYLKTHVPYELLERLRLV